LIILKVQVIIYKQIILINYCAMENHESWNY
jgi:hypothetical protein